ncbi:hypothetical protein TNCV_1882801 [Trichonephila clavipes]|nr:hypothetical protein TNCV_1882801 [Trichonephila clavipes]
MRVKTSDLEEKLDVREFIKSLCSRRSSQNLQINIKAGGKIRRVRALIDSGSQRSYLLKKTAHEMNLKPIEMKNIIHSTFGVLTLQKQDHRVYEITFQNVNSSFSFYIQVFDQTNISGGKFLELVKEFGRRS